MSLLEYSEGSAGWNPKMGHQRHKCHFCKFLTTSFFCAVNHAKRHMMGLGPYHCQSNSVEKYFCRNCNYTTDLTTEFKHHISKFHAKTQSDVGSDKVSQSYRCDKCGFETYSILNWFKHVSNYHSKDVAALVGRDQSDKVVNPQNKDETEWYKCDQCEYKTHERGAFNEHRLGHIKLYKCIDCGHKLSKNITPSQIELKYVVTLYKCDKCRDKTRQKLPLEQRTTTSYCDFSWYECDKCSFRSNHNIYLKLHYKAAHGRGINSTCAFKCHSLPQVLRTKTLLEDPFKIHECDRCKYRTKNKYLLVRHQKRNHWEKLYACEKCEYESLDKADLLAHKVKDHGVAPI